MFVGQIMIIYFVMSDTITLKSFFKNLSNNFSYKHVQNIFDILRKDFLHIPRNELITNYLNQREVKKKLNEWSLNRITIFTFSHRVIWHVADSHMSATCLRHSYQYCKGYHSNVRSCRHRGHPTLYHHYTCTYEVASSSTLQACQQKDLQCSYSSIDDKQYPRQDRHECGR